MENGTEVFPVSTLVSMAEKKKIRKEIKQAIGLVWGASFVAFAMALYSQWPDIDWIILSGFGGAFLFVGILTILMLTVPLE
jgi:hypothetical protein